MRDSVVDCDLVSSSQDTSIAFCLETMQLLAAVLHI